MMLLDDAQRPQLSIPELDQYSVWNEGATGGSSEHRWMAFLNQLTVKTLLPWIDSQTRVAGQISPRGETVSPKIWPSPSGASQLWEWLNGTIVEIESARLLLLPTDTIDTSEFRVPQEWVDIPTWIADYYLMVQLNPDAELLQIRGYVNHRQLKQGHYSPDDRTYSVDESVLVQDLDLLWVMAPLESASERRAEVEAIPEITGLGREGIRLEAFSQRLNLVPLSEPAFPQRLQWPFAQWAAILAEWCERQSSDGSSIQSSSIQSRSIQSSSAQATPVQLGEWFQGKFGEAWFSLEQLFFPQPSLSFRQLHQAPCFSRGKIINLDNLSSSLVLCTTVTSETDGRINVRIQLRPPMQIPSVDQSKTSQQSIASRIPGGLQLTLFNTNNTPLQVVIAQENDDYIQIPRFKVACGQIFNVEIQFEGQSIREQFQV